MNPTSSTGTKPIRVLIQTTIEHADDDWHVGRFSMLRDQLRSLRTPDGSPACEVTARDRETADDDPVLSRLDEAPFDQVWLLAVDVGNGLTAHECEAIFQFHVAGRGILVARDHRDLGSSLRGIRCVAPIEHFHQYQPEADEGRRVDDDRNPAISWPNYHSGWNGDLQSIRPVGPAHPLLFRDGRSAAGGLLGRFPAHPHEGAIAPPADDPNARVVAEGRSTLSGRAFNVVVAEDRVPDTEGRRHGRIIAHSSFHHLCDYNWNTAAGAPSFVDDPPGREIVGDPHALDDIKTYVANAVRWLSAR
jgi:hypothetical protein